MFDNLPYSLENYAIDGLAKLWDMLPSIAGAIVVLWLGWVFARLIRKPLRLSLDRISQNPEANNLIVLAIRFAILGTGAFFALGILGLNTVVSSLLAGVGIITLALSFAFQDIATNLISGVILSIQRPFRKGQLIQTGDHMGIVEFLDLRNTHIRTFTGETILVPNKDIFQNVLINYNQHTNRRVDLPVGVSYSDNLDLVQRVAVEAVQQVSSRDANTSVDLFYTEFGDSSINFLITFWLSASDQPTWLRARSEAIVRIKKAFDQHGVTIPFPIRTLEMATPVQLSGGAPGQAEGA